MTPSSPTRRAASTRSPNVSGPSTTAASSSASTDPSTSSARPRVTPSSCRPGPARTARTSPPATPRPSSPPSRPWRRASPSTRTSRHGPWALGRDPDGIKILPGIVPVIGDTEAEARELDAELDRLIVPEYAKRQLALRLKIAPEDLDLDAELPEDIPTEDEIEGAKSRYTLIVELARREHLTVRQLIGRLGGGRGHRTFAGTAEQVADTIEHWYDSGAADGFNIMPAVLPSGLEVFVDRVVPILQERGLFRTEYTGSTLREHYGLPRPANQLFDTVAPHADLATAGAR